MTRPPACESPLLLVEIVTVAGVSVKDHFNAPCIDGVNDLTQKIPRTEMPGAPFFGDGAGIKRDHVGVPGGKDQILHPHGGNAVGKGFHVKSVYGFFNGRGLSAVGVDGKTAYKMDEETVFTGFKMKMIVSHEINSFQIPRGRPTRRI